MSKRAKVLGIVCGLAFGFGLVLASCFHSPEALKNTATAPKLPPPPPPMNWPSWRGPFQNGTAYKMRLPTRWSKTENVAWVTPLPGRSAATPAIWNDHVFVSSIDAKTKELLALCLSRKNGQILWRKALGYDKKIGRSDTMASPSPMTDGERVYFYFGTGELLAYDFSGNEIWRRNIQKDHGKFKMLHGYAATPLLYQGKLYVPVLHRSDDSYILAIDPKTGADLWKQARRTNARAESKEAYTTPIPYQVNGRTEIVLMGGDYLTGHDSETGAELWRWGTYNPRKIGHWRVVPSAVTGPGLIYIAAPKRAPMYAIKAGGTGRLGDEHVAWKFGVVHKRNNTPDVCTPAYREGNLYVLDGDRKILFCLDAKTGAIKWQGHLGGKDIYRASPTVADGKIYCIDRRGEAVVLAVGDEFKVLSRASMGGRPAQSTIAAAHGQLFIRTADNLYCIGNGK